ncbi:40S ribosomal protein [Talaromyces pinophilus]|uniref:40S ribosomal protein n=1 Tax=Talaromyces pinophilus TaxID=128442 RepID=A0A6V8H9P1_TALPI|nr:40S ribosomal protein [Talaromyces pinophilus]
MTTTNTTKTRICILSDTHTETPHIRTFIHKPYRHPLPKSDIFLHAGDLTKVGRQEEHQIVVDMLKKDVHAEVKIIIAGNHDLTHDRKYYAEKGVGRHGSARLEDPEAIRALYTDDAAKDAGIVYMEEEVRTFTLKNGAKFTVYASPYTPEFCGWAFAYDRDEDRFNPHDGPIASSVNQWVPDFPGVDIMVTHGPPAGVLDKIYWGKNVGCDNLLQACRRAKPRLHVFGHIHEAYGAVRRDWSSDNNTEVEEEDLEIVMKNRRRYIDLSSGAEEPLRYGEETLFVNASIVTVGYTTDNAPWVVDLDLPVA